MYNSIGKGKCTCQNRVGYPGAAESQGKSPGKSLGNWIYWPIIITGIPLDILGCPQIYWDIFGNPGISWDIPVHTRISWGSNKCRAKRRIQVKRVVKGKVLGKLDILGYPRIYQYILRYPGISWEILVGYPSISRYIPVHTRIRGTWGLPMRRGILRTGTDWLYSDSFDTFQCPCRRIPAE